MAVTIRRAEPAQAGALSALALAGKRYWGYPEAWLEAWRAALTITPAYVAAQHVACAADEAGRLVGFVAVERAGDAFRLEHLWLEPAHIGRGLGRHLFAHAVQAAAALGASELLIEADPNAEGFYLHLGARRVGATVSHLTGSERVVPLLRYAVPAGAMLRIALTAPQERALRRLVGILEAAGVGYQFTGGFAGNLYGSAWPLADLDLDVARADLPRLVEPLRPYTTRPLGPYVDDEFELQLLRAEVEGVPVDVSQAEDAYARVGGRRVPLYVTLAHRRRVRVRDDLEVWVQPLEELIAYKELLGRSADLADLRSLP